MPQGPIKLQGRTAHLTEFPFTEKNTMRYTSHDYVIQADQLVREKAVSPGTKTQGKSYYMGPNNNNGDDSSLYYILKNGEDSKFYVMCILP